MSPRETGSTRKIEFLLRRIEKLQRRLQKILNQRDRSKIKNILIAWVFVNYCCEYLAEYLSFRKENDKGFSGEKSYRTPPPEDYIDNYISLFRGEHTTWVDDDIIDSIDWDLLVRRINESQNNFIDLMITCNRLWDTCRLNEDPVKGHRQPVLYESILFSDSEISGDIPDEV